MGAEPQRIGQGTAPGMEGPETGVSHYTELYEVREPETGANIERSKGVECNVMREYTAQRGLWFP